MFARRDQYKSSYGAFTAQQRELERGRERRDARDAADKATTDAEAEATTEATTEATPDAATDVPDDDPAGVTAAMPVVVREDVAVEQAPPPVPKADKTTARPPR